MNNIIWLKQGAALIQEINSTDTESVQIWYIGQMGLFLRYKGLTICIDPVLTDLTDTNGQTRRNYKPPFSPEEAPHIDYLLCSHNHADHMNFDTILPIYQSNPDIRFIIPAPLKEELTSRGIKSSNIIYAREKVSINCMKMQVYPIAAAHEDYITDRNGDYTCMGYILDFEGTRLYHAGDTMLTKKLENDLREYSPISMAFLPINGYGKPNLVGNMNYAEAAGFASRLAFRTTVPMHYDMIMGNTEDPALFAKELHKLAPDADIHVPILGESFTTND
ncbi:MAG: MBL fold metallo-hydrolase [Lachnospiraceae bacterium]|nr:MBL fold metallo-hydrolase [Lachnospiraceae bacterium]